MTSAKSSRDKLQWVSTSSIFAELIRLNLLAWCVFFVIFNLYCVLWRQYASQIEYHFFDSLIWFAKEWAVYFLISPLLLWFLSAKASAKNLPLVWCFAGIICLTVILSTRLLWNVGEYPADWTVTVVLLLPKYLFTYVVIVMVCFFKSRVETPTVVSKSVAQTVQPQNEKNIHVEHQGLTLAVNPEQIFSVKAAGNYIEIACQEASYLKRITLKNLLLELPENNFIQIHRSYAINVNKLLKVNNAANGSGMAILSNQTSIPVSKRYKPLLKSRIIALPEPAELITE